LRVLDPTTAYGPMRRGTPLASFVLLLLPVLTANAQSVGGCALGTAAADLAVNGVRARLYNKGNLFFDGGEAQYEVPRGSGITSIFAAGIWIGGLVEGELRTAAATYAQGGEDYEYYPGPLDAEGRPPEDCRPYDRIWTVGHADLARYEETGVASDDLAEWPAEAGAPFFDVDGDGAYSLEAGDRPKVWGHQTAWWVMNDAAGPHMTTLSEPIGLAVRATAFAAATTGPLAYTTFYRYELEYRGEAPIDSTYFTFWCDPDLGNFNDDYIGSDTTRHLTFVYNADDEDETSAGYGAAPPAQGVRYLETPDDLGLTVFSYYNGDANPRTGNPDTKEDYYSFMTGHWRDGSPVTVGGDGTALTGEPTTFVYPNSGTWEDTQPRYWSEKCPQAPICGSPIAPNDRRFHTSTGPFRMEPGQTEVVTFALVWARGSDHFRSLQAMKVASDYAARAYAYGVLDPVPPEPPGPPELPEALAFGVAPSPFRDETTVRLTVPEGAPPVRVSAFDALGREVAVLAEGTLAPGEHALLLGGEALPPGVYAVRLEVQGQTRTALVTRVE
jgi:hypothetical protein